MLLQKRGGRIVGRAVSTEGKPATAYERQEEAMSLQAIAAVVGLIMLAIVSGTLQRTLINYVGSKAITATQGNRPKSKPQKFFGW